MLYDKELAIDAIIKKIGENIVEFQYISLKFGDSTLKQTQHNVYRKLILIFLTRILMLRDYRKPVRQRIANIDDIEKLYCNFVDCIITASFKINKNSKYICFFNKEEIILQKSFFTSDFLSQLINSNAFNQIFDLFVPIEVLYFERLDNMQADFYKRVIECINSADDNDNVLFEKINSSLDYVVNDLSLEARVYLAQLFCLDYRDLIFQVCNKLIAKQYKILSIQNTDIYYH